MHAVAAILCCVGVVLVVCWWCVGLEVRWSHHLNNKHSSLVLQVELRYACMCSSALCVPLLLLKNESLQQELYSCIFGVGG